MYIIHYDKEVKGGNCLSGGDLYGHRSTDTVTVAGAANVWDKGKPGCSGSQTGEICAYSGAYSRLYTYERARGTTAEPPEEKPEPGIVN